MSRLLITEEEKNSILEKYGLITEQGTFLSIFPNVNILKSADMNINPNSNVIYLTKRGPNNTVVPNSKFSYKVSGSYGFLSFDVKLRNFKRGADGSLNLEAQPTNGAVLSVMKKLVPSNNLTTDGWLKVYIPVDKINSALEKLFKNKGSVAEIDAGNGVEIELEQIS